MKAADIKIGTQYKTDKAGVIVEVMFIDKVTDKAITFRVKRIAPTYYDASGTGIFERKSLNTIIKTV